METKEFEFKGFAMNGFVALFIEFAILAVAVVGLAFTEEYPIFPLFSVICFLI